MHMLKFSYTTTAHSKILNVVEYMHCRHFGYYLSFLVIVSDFVSLVVGRKLPLKYNNRFVGNSIFAVQQLV